VTDPLLTSEGPPPEADVHTSSPDYARRFSGEVGAWFLAVQAEITLRLLAPWPAARVLDVGGGHGQLTQPLLHAGYHVTVHGTSDLCSDGLGDLLREGRILFRAGPLLSLPWPDGAFDVVLAFRLLPHVDPWPRLLGELCRVARRAVVVDYPTRRSINVLSGGALFRAKKGVEGNTRPFRVFSEGEIDRAFDACSFSTTARQPEFTLPMALHRALGKAGLSKTLEGVAGGLGLTRILGSPVIRRAEPHG